MNGLAVGMQAAGIGILVLLTMTGVAISLLLSSIYVLHRKAGRFARLKTATKRIGIGLGVALLVGAGWSYHRAADTRDPATRFHTVRSVEDGGLYTAGYAYLAGDRILLRVYRTSDMALLAERTYWNPDAAKLIWTRESLIYDTAASDGDGLVPLPPSLIDRLSARLP